MERGQGRAGENKRDVQGKQAKELKSRQGWRPLQMNQATSVVPLSLSHPHTPQASSPVTTVHTSSPLRLFSGATAHSSRHGAWNEGMERLVASFWFLWLGSGGEGRGRRECLREAIPFPWRQMQVGPAHAQANYRRA